MPYGLYISAEGARAQSRRLEVIANNMANVGTTGFKRDLAIFQARYAEETQQGLDSPGSRTINDIGGGVEFRETVTTFSPGPLDPTHLPNDLAIEGEGFFLVRKDGQDYLTRAGNFVITPNGDLLTPDGHAVINADGEPMSIPPERGAHRWTEDGAVVQPGTKQFLAIVKPPALGDLAKAGEYLFSSLAEVEPVDPSKRNVKQGFLEKSAVRPTQEMMHMIEASRVFEANVNLIQNQDQMYGALITRVLRTA